MTPEEVTAARQLLTARAAIKRVRARHHAAKAGDVCPECAPRLWPCPTIRDLDDEAQR